MLGLICRFHHFYILTFQPYVLGSKRSIPNIVSNMEANFQAHEGGTVEDMLGII